MSATNDVDRILRSVESMQVRLGLPEVAAAIAVSASKLRTDGKDERLRALAIEVEQLRNIVLTAQDIESKGALAGSLGNLRAALRKRHTPEVPGLKLSCKVHGETLEWNRERSVYACTVSDVPDHLAAQPGTVPTACEAHVTSEEIEQYKRGPTGAHARFTIMDTWARRGVLIDINEEE